ncbi:MAG: glycoside hydrolase family 27 protein [Clostridia bacterium]|nr:glycoside hydrolase family 27 protein [Clostridia bacterium]
MDHRRKTPIMGWASWNCFRTNISEQKLKTQFDRLVSTGLAACGYEYANTDDGFFGGRGEDGALRFHKERFSNGIKPLADYAHSLGLKAGIYSEAGATSCGYYYDNEGENGVNVGLCGHETEDLSMFLEECGFDFIKVDWCGALREGVDERAEYEHIARVIEDIRRRTGRVIVYNICRKFFPGEWAVDIADSWRTAADINPNFDSIIRQLDHVKPLRKYCAPGHVNDLDMMQIGNGLTHEEEKTHFAMWCMMSTPLMIGCDLTTISDETLSVLKNKELIALDQDPACKQACVVKEYRDGEGALIGEVWVKELAEEGAAKRAIAFLNRSKSPLEMSISPLEAGLGGMVLTLRDLWTHQDIAPDSPLTFTVPPHGTVMLRATSETAAPVTDVNAHMEYHEPAPMATISREEARALVQGGALLLDCRAREEYAQGHLFGALNTPFTEIYSHIWETVPTKDTPCVLYCSKGLRSAQVKYTMEHMGYTRVYMVGGVDPREREI